MAKFEDFEGRTSAWCPGCGNFGILKSFKQAMVELELEPHQFTIVSGIGQSGKFPHYVRCNTFNGLHGRSLPVATGLRLANHRMPVFAFAGDGDCYGEGGNHLTHAIRRNINVKLFVHDNQIYGLTKGQPSPTSMEGTVSKIQPMGLISESFNPVAYATALDCSFVARGYAGDGDHLKELIKKAVNHQGFSLVDILQPCVTFNKVNTYDWYKERCYYLEPEYDSHNRIKAFERALEYGERIPLGVLYKSERPCYEDRVPAIEAMPLVKQVSAPPVLKELMEEFF
ncbi:MAG TPA: 2-oxoacid:ferredoxin oxidoreductase subunit beta [Syntrophorhabdaceae bacterium]|jgi:2-oxoglutarate ferredoxin oxidoreductase subunit beta